MRKSKVLALCLAFALCIGVFYIPFTVSANENTDSKVTIQHSIPGTMKIGEAICDLPDYKVYYHNLIPGKTIAGHHNTLWDTKLLDNSFSNYGSFGQHAGGDSFEEVDENGDSIYFKLWHFNTFFRPGSLSLQIQYQYYDIETDSYIGSIVNAGDPINIQIEEPIIKTNAPATIKQGDSLNLTTALTNTALKNKSVADYDNPANWDEDHIMYDSDTEDGIDEAHIPAYRPNIEILEGKEIVKQDKQDYSNTLKSSENLTFTGAGTVKLKVKYNQFITCSDCMAILDDNYEPTGKFNTYSPEKIITISVTKDGNPPTTNDNNKSDLESSINQKPGNASDYTDDSYKAYTDALKKAEAVLNNPNATSEQIEQAKNDLEAAKSNLKPVSKSENTSAETDTTGKSETSNPKTGDTTPIIPLLALISVSTGAIYFLRKKRKA